MLLQDKKIFLVEDDVVNLLVIRTLLKNEGAIVPLDAWGDITLSKLEKFEYDIDLIILDLSLRHGNTGYMVFEEIKKSVQWQDVPIVAVTASDADIEMPKAKALGFDGYISKPINPRIFAKQIADIINGATIWS